MQQTNSFSKFSLPQIIVEAPFTLEVDDGRIIEFTELRFTKEANCVVPAQKHFGVLNDHILQQSGCEKLTKIDLSKVQAFSLSCENMQTSSSTVKIISRICLVTDQGQRVLDTLVSSFEQVPTGEKVVVKDGLKTKLHLLADARGPKL